MSTYYYVLGYPGQQNLLVHLLVQKHVQTYRKYYNVISTRKTKEA